MLLLHICVVFLGHKAELPVLQGAANSWLSMQNTAGATWTAELMFFGCAPFDFRLTDALGQTVLLR